MGNYSSLAEFTAAIKQNGMPTASHFNVIIGGSKQNRVSPQRVMMMCDTTNLPGYTHMTTEMRTYGEIFEMPYGISYPDLNMTFYLDNTVQSKTFFDNWSNEIFNKKTRTIGYYRDYVRDMDLYLQNLGGNVIYQVKVYEAYPKLIGDFQVDYTNRDILRLSVVMKYKWLEIIDSTASGEPREFLDTPVDYPNYSANMPRNEGYGNFTGIAEDQYAVAQSSFTGQYQDLLSVGKEMQTSIPRATNQLSAALGSSSLPSSLITNSNTLGSQFSSLGGNIQLLANSNGSVAGPSAMISSNVTGISNTVNTMAGTMSGLGIDTSGLMAATAGLQDVASDLNTVNSMVRSVSAMTSLGSNLGFMGGQFSSVSNSISNAQSVVMGAANLGRQVSAIGSSISGAMRFFS